MVSWHYHHPHPFHYLFYSNLETSKNSPHSKAILQLSIKSLTVGSVDIQKKVKFPKNRDVQCPHCKDGICASNVCPRQAQPTSHALTVGSTGNTQYNINTHNNVTDWLLPHQIAQSTIFGISIGSNACTVIAVMGARKFLDSQHSIPTSENVLSCIAVFADAMREGNMNYNTINLPSHQSNLDVNETLQTRDGNFGLRLQRNWACFLLYTLRIK